jgi:predicted HicB family RNase H-like nuclease
MSDAKTAIGRLKTVWGKVGLNDIPGPEETKGTLEQPEPGRKKSERTAQLNLRIRPSEKELINLIAVREKVKINEVFSRMLALYEREQGKAELAASRHIIKK